MKKLIVATGIVLSVMCASAASYSWKAYNDYFADTSDADLAGKVYLFDANAYALATVTAGLESSGLSALSGSLGSADLSGAAFTLTGTGLGSNAADTIASMYAIVISTDEKNYWAAPTVDVTLNDAIRGGGIASFNFGAVDGVAWTGEVAAVPEPTSGLLLLLGMAGLALKRKRA